MYGLIYYLITNNFSKGGYSRYQKSRKTGQKLDKTVGLVFDGF